MFDAQQDRLSQGMITKPDQLELRHLRYFHMVAEEMHFRKAADKLYISQPGLSRQIAQLEEELGVKLFDRNNRNVALTEAGRYFLQETQLLLKNLSSIVSHTRSIDKGEEGSFNFGYIGSAMQNVIPELLVKVRKEYPAIHFDLKEMDNQKQIHSLLSHDIDIGFIRMERIPKGLELKPVFEDTFSLVLPKDHPLDETTFADISQLRDEPFILFDTSYSKTYYDKVMRIFDDAGFTPHISHKTVHATTIYRLVENHFGVSIVPSALKLGYDLPVKFIELKNIPHRTTLSAVWNKDNRNPILEKILLMCELGNI